MEINGYKEFDLIINDGKIREDLIIDVKSNYPKIQYDLLVLLNYLIAKIFPTNVVVNVAIAYDRFTIEIKMPNQRWINVVYWLQNSRIVNIHIDYIKVVMYRNNLDLKLLDKITNKILHL